MKKIWIVDDDEEMGRAASLMLKLLDFDAQYFFHPRKAAQALLAGNAPDLMLLDISMPEVSGLDMLEFIRRRKEWQDLPIIMLTSEASDVTIDQALALGADGYIKKPVTIEELESAIAQAFAKH
ncbi:MAG: response regulator [Anaerolineales bacterium]